MSAWGVFQAHYEQTQLRSSSPSAIAWIGSIQQSFLYIPTLLSTRLMDRGYFRSMITSASIVFVISIVLVAECRVYWQFLICQGVCTGIAAGVFTGPVTAIISQWFHQNRGLALGVFAAGASIGGITFSLAAKMLIPLIGFSWTMRAIALIIALALILGNLTLRQREASSIVNEPPLDLSPLRSKTFLLYCTASFFVYLGYYTFTTYVAASAITVGVSTGFSFYLVSICNASSGLSRTMSGIIADKIGAMNLMIPVTAISTVIYYIWPFVHSQHGLVVLCVFYGISIGPFASLVSVPVLDLGEKDQVGRRIGILMSISGTAMLVGAPVSGALSKISGPHAMGFYAGKCHF
ncbi:hypothetical protein GYMLUDRAFT_225744 [Collybiopsis luxurians FD-317 M1]|uniref:Major facilitator superfamily (MFS) profile domain-containing protein n=1 Tax=Collybiopsis luxurians FD-317 M1 TaxID=944289 RepID=A0A0D0CE07_9AGAR|nr:hypothetical protein GYMLUDRAFT_225744 [Collybiopsis luxurians FD-317 M1]